MEVRILDLDQSLTCQEELVAQHRPRIVPLAEWGPRIRLGSSWSRFRRFSEALAVGCGSQRDTEPTLTLYGSGDFHHVSLALLHRQSSPFNLVVIDNHPDWMRGVPFLHCGTWVYHAACLPMVHRIIHIGGDVDFDNYYRWMAPWSWLSSGKIAVLPARRCFDGKRWTAIPHSALRNGQETVAERIERLLKPFHAELGRLPLYISLDKDVLGADQAIVNWDSGHLKTHDVHAILSSLIRAAGSCVAGMDIVGDWSPVTVRGLLRTFLHITEHPRLEIKSDEATRRNEVTNLELVRAVLKLCSQKLGQVSAA